MSGFSDWNGSWGRRVAVLSLCILSSWSVVAYEILTHRGRLRELDLFSLQKKQLWGGGRDVTAVSLYLQQMGWKNIRARLLRGAQ